MLNRKRDYPFATTGSLTGEQAQTAAIRWVLAEQKELGGHITLYVANKSAFNDRQNQRLQDFAKQHGVSVTKDTILGGGIILAAWPSRDALASIMDGNDIRALCVIPWSPGDTEAWEQVANPERLDGSGAPEPKTLTLDPVVIEGLKTATIMTEGELNSSLDRRDADDVLKRLRRAGYELPPDDIYAWALAHSWRARHAAEFSRMAAHINGLKTTPLRKDSALRPDILQTWRASAEHPEAV